MSIDGADEECQAQPQPIHLHPQTLAATIVTSIARALLRLQHIYNFLLFHAIILSTLDVYGLYYTLLYYFWD